MFTVICADTKSEHKYKDLFTYSLMLESGDAYFNEHCDFPLIETEKVAERWHDFERVNEDVTKASVSAGESVFDVANRLGIDWDAYWVEINKLAEYFGVSGM